MLEIKDLYAGIDGNEILKGISLTVKKGEIHAIMGPNGSGKSTWLKALNLLKASADAQRLPFGFSVRRRVA